MDKKILKKYSEIKNKTLTTSEVIKGSFSNVLSMLREDDYVLVENQRQKVTMVIQKLEDFVGVQTTVNEFGHKAISNSNENRLLARTFIKENVYFLMKFESPNITFPVIDKVFNNNHKEFLQEFDEVITKQLIDAWKYLIRTPELFSYELFLKLNGIIAKDQALEWGVLRTGEVGISGTEFKPNIPTEESVKEILGMNILDPYIKSMKMLVRLIKSQIFWDGNKRTAFLIVNKYMIDNSLGCVVVDDTLFDSFNEYLSDYYNDESKEEVLIGFLLENCIYNTLNKKLIKA